MSGTGQPTTRSDDERGEMARVYAELAVREAAHMVASLAIGDDYGAAAHRQFSDNAARMALELAK